MNRTLNIVAILATAILLWPVVSSVAETRYGPHDSECLAGRWLVIANGTEVAQSDQNVAADLRAIALSHGSQADKLLVNESEVPQATRDFIDYRLSQGVSYQVIYFIGGEQRIPEEVSFAIVNQAASSDTHIRWVAGVSRYETAAIANFVDWCAEDRVYSPYPNCPQECRTPT